MNQADISDLFLKIKGIGPWTLGIIQMFYTWTRRHLLDW
jgi:3-methyladenine DNA glycosylase/8-oxoguanine DNA glycosylase